MPFQAIIFKRDVWAQKDAKSWLRNHGYTPLKAVHVTTNYLRYRIFNPLPGDVFRMVNLGNSIKGVNLVA